MAVNCNHEPFEPCECHKKTDEHHQLIADCMNRYEPREITIYPYMSEHNAICYLEGLYGCYKCEAYLVCHHVKKLVKSKMDR